MTNDYTAGQFPRVRMRRMRRDDFSRRMMRETTLTPSDFIYPVFVMEGVKQRVPVPSMPGIERLTVDELVREATAIARLGVPAIALFPVTAPEAKSLDGSEAWNPDGLAQRAVRAIKRRDSRPRRRDRRRARSVHDARPGRHHRRQRLRHERRDGGGTGQARAVTRRGRRRCRRAFGHDGRAHRRAARRARACRAYPYPHPGVFGEIRLELLWSVPRCRRLVG